MTSIQRFALGFLVLTAAAAAGFVLTAPRTVQPAGGTLAATGGAGAPTVFATVPADRLAAGPLIALAPHGDAVYLLQNHAWLRVSGRHVSGPHGSGVRGARGVLAAAAAIVPTDTAVYVLDRLARALLVYAPDGEWRRTITLARAGLDGFSPESFVLDAHGRILIAGFQATGAAAWQIVWLDGERASRIFSRSGSAYDIVLPLADRTGHAYALAATDYTFTELHVSGAGARHFRRAQPPRVPMPAPQRAAAAIAGPLPDFVPAAAHAFALARGGFLVAVAATPDEVWIEEIDENARPLHTLIAQPVALPVGLSDRALFTLREEAQQTIIERRLLRSRP